jgi:GTP-binding protein
LRQFDDYSSFTLCDIPGIVEGAHLGRGLGLEFLRHIERTRVLCFVVDAAPGPGQPAAWDAFRLLADELDRHDPRMRRDKRCLLAVNKMDLPGALQVCVVLIDPFQLKKKKPF